MKPIGFLFGGAFGAAITAGRLNEYGVIHAGLRLQNLYMFFVMGSAVAVAMAGLYSLERVGWTTPLGGALDLGRSRIERKHILGGVTFGVGWAIAGTCPAPALAMVGSGGVLGLVVVAGIFFGLMSRDIVAELTARRPSRHSTDAGRAVARGGLRAVDL
jgi:uncharacterized membrane protein YedE/YeeE